MSTPLTVNDLTGNDTENTPLQRPILTDFKDARAFMKAMQEYNTAKNKQFTTGVENEKKVLPENCEFLPGSKKNDLDILLKFQRDGYEPVECIYLNTFLSKFVNNSCNIFIKWVFKDAGKPKDENKEGMGFKPILTVDDIISTLDNAVDNEYIAGGMIDNLYWKLPFFGGFYLTIDSLLNIQQRVLVDTGSSSILFKLHNTQLPDGFRLGNLYGSFGIGEIHAQDASRMIYNIPASSSSATRMAINQSFFKMSSLVDQIYLHLRVMTSSNEMDFDIVDGNLPDALNESAYIESDLCPSTTTVLGQALTFYNNTLLNFIDERVIPVIYTADDDTVIMHANAMHSELKEVNTDTPLKESRNIIKRNQEIRNELLNVAERFSNMDDFSESDYGNNESTDWPYSPSVLSQHSHASNNSLANMDISPIGNMDISPIGNMDISPIGSPSGSHSPTRTLNFENVFDEYDINSPQNSDDESGDYGLGPPGQGRSHFGGSCILSKKTRKTNKTSRKRANTKKRTQVKKRNKKCTKAARKCKKTKSKKNKTIKKTK